MVLPLILGMLGGGLGTAGMIGGLGALGGAAVGSGLGSFIETGDLETGILTGLGAFAGGSILGPLMGGGAGAAGATGTAAGTTAGTAGTAGAAGAGAATLPMSGTGVVKSLLPELTAKQASMGIGGIGRGAMDFAKSGAGMGAGVGAAMGASLGPMFSGMDTGKKKYTGDSAKEMPAMPRNIQFPGQGYQPGVSGEFDYGFGPPPGAADIIKYRDTGVNPYKMAGGGMLRSLQNTFGPIRLAAGGIASLVGEGGEGEVPAGASVGGNEKDVVVEAVRAIKGESRNPEVALGAFLAQYGEDALRDLVDKVQSGEADDTVRRSEGKMSGAGDGMDDLIPASIEGEQDVLLSDGEFVVPADVVSGLGNGSSDAGARTLEDMMTRVRTARNGTPEQPPKVPKEAMLPA